MREGDGLQRVPVVVNRGGLFSIDSEWLVVKCEQGFVVSARVVTD
jgi:hypothetical protein